MGQIIVDKLRTVMSQHYMVFMKSVSNV